MTPLSCTSFPKILTLHPGALGDGLFSLPSLRKLRRLYPGNEVIWIGHPELGEVFVNAGEVHGAYSFESFHMGNTSEMGLSTRQSVQSCLSNKDLAVGWMKDGDGYWKAWVEQLGYARSIFQSPHEPQLSSQHMLERHWEALEQGVESFRHPFVAEDYRKLKGVFPRFHLPFGHPLRESLEKGCLLLLHPGSGSSRKCVSAETFSRLAKKIITRFPGRVAFIAGPADTSYLEPLLTFLPDIQPLCFEHLDLLSICGLFNQVKLFIGHDSGLSHLAAHCGVPSVLLFGPTDPAVWGPRGPHVRVRRNQDLCFSPDNLCEVVEELLQERQSWFMGSRDLEECQVLG